MHTFTKMLAVFAVAACLVFPNDALSATYSIENESPLLDGAFYSQAPAGKFAIGAGLSNNGKTLFVTALDLATLKSQFYLADLGSPDSWRRVLGGQDFPLVNEPAVWTPDDTHVVYYNLRFDLANDLVIDDTTYWNSTYGIWFMSGTMTRQSSGNWRCVVSNTVDPEHEDTRELVMLPVLPNGAPDTSREPVQITNMDVTTPNQTIWTPYVSADGNSLIFNYVDRTTGEIRVYAMNDVGSILTAHQPGVLLSPLAPSSLNDPAISLIRAATGQSLGGTAISPDASLVFMQQDFNGMFNQNNPLGTLPLSDFDPVVAPSSGVDSGFRVVAPGNQYGLSATPGGVRVFYFKDISGMLQGFIATLRTATAVSGNQLGGNNVQSTTVQTAVDGSGTTINIPSGLTLDFPEGAPQEVQIATPSTPVLEAQLPPGVNAIPVLREFGPAGTAFSAPISVTITYTDAEIEGLDESGLALYLFNETTGVYDIPINTITAHDMENNTITFTVTHFSVYGLGAGADTDGDGTPDSTDLDDDNDGIPDTEDSFPLDTDNDSQDNDIDPDDDGDGIMDSEDPSLYDTDNDGVQNDVDPDDDGDGISDSDDIFPFDRDNDHVRNDADPDDDNDGIPDQFEGFADVDGDGIPNNIDLDSDGDGASDLLENSLGTNPFDYWHPNRMPVIAWPAAAILAVVGILVLRKHRRTRT